MFDKTAGKLKAGISESLAMPVRQSFVMSVVAVIFAIIAIMVAVKR
jgi:hypothetical protein